VNMYCSACEQCTAACVHGFLHTALAVC
jgi:hypothetical protein